MKIYILDEDGKWVYLGEGNFKIDPEPEGKSDEIEYPDEIKVSVEVDVANAEGEIDLEKAAADWAYNVELLQRGDLN